MPIHILGGTLASATVRTHVCAQSPLTGFFGSTNMGRFFAPELRWAGFDHLVIKGRAEKPVYLWVHDGQIEIRDAANLWGLNVHETQRAIRNELGDEDVKVVDTYKGKKLKGLKYHPLFTFMPTDRPAHFVVLGDFVTTEDGTGLVHVAPAFGQEDMEMAKQHNLPVLMTVKPDGTFVPEVTPWRGVFGKEADPAIMEDLRARGLLFKSGEYTHTYPFCWRCHTPLLYYARDAQ